MLAHRSVATMIAISASIVACGGTVQTAPRAPDAQPARLTSAEVPRTQAPPQSARPHTAMVETGGPVGPDPMRLAEENASTREEIARVTRERDNARQWAADEQRRQQDAMKLKQERDQLAEHAWLQVEDIDANIAALRTRLDQWTIRDRKEAYARLVEIEQERAALNPWFKRIHSEPAHAYPQFQERLRAQLDDLAQKTRTALEMK